MSLLKSSIDEKKRSFSFDYQREVRDKIHFFSIHQVNERKTPVLTISLMCHSSEELLDKRFISFFDILKFKDEFSKLFFEFFSLFLFLSSSPTVRGAAREVATAGIAETLRNPQRNG